MKVYFPGPMQETWHPRLGHLVKDRVFDLRNDVAGPYIKSGLLLKAAGKKKTSSRAPGKE